MFSFTQTGTRLKLVINNRTIGLVTGFSYTIDYGRKALRGIDSPFPQEIVSGQQTVRGTVNCIKLQGTSLENYGIVSTQAAPQEGTAANQQPISGMLEDPYISIALVDRQTQEVVFRADLASLNNQQWSVGARGIMQGSFEFEGIIQGGGN